MSQVLDLSPALKIFTAPCSVLEINHWWISNKSIMLCHPLLCCKFDKQTPNLCLNQFYLHNTQASHTHRKIFINPPKLVAQPRSMALIDHNRRGYQRGTRPNQRALKYAPERTTGGTYMPHGHIFIFILSSFFYLSSETSYDFLVKPVSFLTLPQRIS